MNPPLFILLVLGGTIAVCFAMKWVIDKTFQAPTPAPMPAKDAAETAKSPYRTAEPASASATPSKPAGTKATAPLPVIIVEWSRPARKDNKFSAVCPACRTNWIWQKDAAPLLCACEKCGDTHFHLDCCSGGNERGCEFKWIMRSALTKKDETPAEKPETPKEKPAATEDKPS